MNTDYYTIWRLFCIFLYIYSRRMHYCERNLFTSFPNATDEFHAGHASTGKLAPLRLQTFLILPAIHACFGRWRLAIARVSTNDYSEKMGGKNWILYISRFPGFYFFACISRTAPHTFDFSKRFPHSVVLLHRVELISRTPDLHPTGESPKLLRNLTKASAPVKRGGLDGEFPAISANIQISQGHRKCPSFPPCRKTNRPLSSSLLTTTSWCYQVGLESFGKAERITRCSPENTCKC